MNSKGWLCAALAIFLLGLPIMTQSVVGDEAGQPAVDPALVGTWRLSSQNQNGAVMFVWVIGSDGHYQLDFQGPHNKKNETGQLSFANGNWNLQSDAGRTDGGTYQARDPNTLAVVGKGGTGIWFRARDPQPAAAAEGNAPAATGPVDSQIVGTWRWELPSPDGPVVITWTIDANGQYRSSSQGVGTAVQDTGQVTFSQGSWSKQSESGKTNQGTYNLIDQDTLSVTGSAGRTAKWLRLVNAASVIAGAPPAAAAPPAETPTVPPVAVAQPPASPETPPANNPGSIAPAAPASIASASPSGIPNSPLSTQSNQAPGNANASNDTASGASNSSPNPVVEMGSNGSTAANTLTVKTESIGTVPGGLTKDGSTGAICTVSPDGKHFAIVIAPNVIIDGKSYPADGLIGPPAFTPDCNHFVFLLTQGNQQAIDIDGNVGPAYAKIGPLNVSADGKRIAYSVYDGKHWALVVDGNVGAFEYEKAGMPMFSSDGQHVVFGVSKKVQEGRNLVGRAFVAYDGKEFGPYFSVPGCVPGLEMSAKNEIATFANKGNIAVPSFLFSPDSQHFAFVATVKPGYRRNSHCVVYDGQAGPPYDGTDPEFSANGKYLGYSMFSPTAGVVINGTAGPTYSSMKGPVFFSADGNHYAYVATKSDNLQYIVQDGIEGQPFTGIKDFPDSEKRSFIQNTLNLSSDGSLLAYVVKKDNYQFATVINGQESTRYNNVDRISFSPDGKHYAYIAEIPPPGGTDLVGDGKVIDHAPPFGTSIGTGSQAMGQYCLDYTPDGKHLVYDRSDANGSSLMVDSTAWPSSGSISGLTYVQGGKHIAYVTGENGHQQLVVDGKAGPVFDTVSPPVFSPDGEHWAYEAVINQQPCVVVDDKLGPQVDFPILPYWSSGIVNDSLSNPFFPSRMVQFDANDNLQYLAVKNNELVRVSYHPGPLVAAPPANPAQPAVIGSSAPQTAAPPAQPDQPSLQGSVAGGNSNTVASNASANSQNSNPPSPVAATNSGQQAVDPAMVGTWRVVLQQGNAVITLAWSIDVDGRYRLGIQGPGNKVDTGQSDFKDGTWNARSDSGETTQGTYKVRDKDTVIMGEGPGTQIWLRSSGDHVLGGAVAGIVVAPPNGLEPVVDPAVVGTWRMGVQTPNGSVIAAWAISASGHYRMSFQGATNQPDETGRIVFSQGNMRMLSDGGRLTRGIYNAVDSETLTLGGDTGAPVIWLRQADAPPMTDAASPAKATSAAPDVQANAGQAFQNTSDLEGNWFGKSGSNDNGGCTFKNDGSIIWSGNSPNGNLTLSGIYFVSKGDPYWTIDLGDFADPKLNGVSFKGILQPISQNEFKMEISSNETRPANFSAQAKTYLRADARAGAAPAEPTPTEPAPTMPASATGNVPTWYVCKLDSEAINQIDANGKVTPFVQMPASCNPQGGMAFDKSGNLYVAEYPNQAPYLYQIIKITPDGAISIFSTPTTNHTCCGLACDSSGNLCVSEQNMSDSQISKITPAAMVSTLATLPNGSAAHGMAFDSHGNLYVTGIYTNGNGGNNVVEITTEGAAKLFANVPMGSILGCLAFDGGGNLYAVNSNLDHTQKIDKISADGSTVSTLATLSADSKPGGLACDSAANVYVADSAKNQVIKITPAGEVSIFATGVDQPSFIAFQDRPVRAGR